MKRVLEAVQRQMDFLNTLPDSPQKQDGLLCARMALWVQIILSRKMAEVEDVPEADCSRFWSEFYGRQNVAMRCDDGR